MTATLRVSCRAYERPESKRRPRPGYLPDWVPSWEVLAGMTVEPTGKEDGDESEVILRDGQPAWIESRYL